MENLIKEQDLIDLGFERRDETAKSSGSFNDWYYYVLNIGDFCLITDASDEVENDNWIVRIFNYNGFEFTQVEPIIKIIDILKNNLKKIQ